MLLAAQVSRGLDNGDFIRFLRGEAEAGNFDAFENAAAVFEFRDPPRVLWNPVPQ